MVDKSYTAYKTIGEVSKEIGVPTHVLRFWETKFKKIKPLKRRNGHRYYTLENISTISHIKSLLQDKGFTVRGAQKLLNATKQDTDSEKDNSEGYLVKKELIEIKSNLKEIVNTLKISSK